VFSPDHHPGPDQTKILVNGLLTELEFDALKHHGIDVALVKIPPQLDQSKLVFHKRGLSRAGGTAFYTHAWSAPRSDPNNLFFTKIWGVRFGPADAMDLRADPRVAKSAKAWVLRSDVSRPPTKFETALFQTGWSGAPVFNVRQSLEDHRVVGVLKIVAGFRDATAISVESLDFLEPLEEQDLEARPTRELPSWWDRLIKKRPATTAFAFDAVARREERDNLYAVRFEETSGQIVCPKIPEPRSPYDPL
jgi:hypothetical protein